MTKPETNPTPENLASGNGQADGAERVDVASQEAAAIYAKALLGAAETAGKAKQVAEEGLQIVGFLAEQPKFEAVLASELLGDDEKQGIITRVFASRFDKTLVDFLRVLSRRDRLGLLRPILRELDRQFHEAKGKVPVHVTTAAPLPREAGDKLVGTLRPLVGGEPVLKTAVDPSLIGGLVVRIGDTVYDGSVAQQLERLKSQMITRSVHEIQSRRDRFRHPGGN
jgi:F-type H+-transporting ATPase subunit delta